VQRVFGVPARGSANAFTVERTTRKVGEAMRLATVTVRYPDGGASACVLGRVVVSGAEPAPVPGPEEGRRVD